LRRANSDRADQERAAATRARRNLRPGQRVFVGVIDPISPTVETPEQVRDHVLEAAEYIPVDQLGTTDDCGFSPFADDTSTARETAFAKIRARIGGSGGGRRLPRSRSRDASRLSSLGAGPVRRVRGAASPASQNHERR
jgi:Cobalamin-independent synthase, Catalytic domain